MKKKRQPGQPCCDGCPCLIAKDSLAADPLSNKWTLKTGSWDDVAVVDEYAQSTDVVELWHVTPHPDDPFPADVRAKVRGQAGAVLRLVISASGDVDTGAALIVELTPGVECGTLKIWQRLDGDEDLLATANVYALAGEWHNLRGCYDPETATFTGSVLPHGERVWRILASEIENHADGDAAGIAAGTDDQSDFDSFVYRKLWYDKLATPTCPELSVAETVKGHGLISGVQPTWTIPFGGYAWNTGTDTAFNVKIGSISLSVLSYGYPTLQDMVDRFNFLCGPPWNRNVTFSYTGGWPTPEVITITGSGDDGYGLAEGYVSDAVFEWGDPMVNSYILSIQYESGTAESPAQNEIQTITIIHDGDEGCQVFALSFAGEQTASISTSADAATVQAALEALSTIGSGNVSVTGSAGGPWAVEFTGTLAETDVPMLTIDNTVCGTCLDYDYYYEPEMERVVCNYCGSCCVFSVPLHDQCDMTVVSGEWENTTDTFQSEISCRHGLGHVLHSKGAGAFQVETTLPIAQSWGITAVFSHVPYNETRSYRIDFDNGDYVVVDWSGTGCGLQISLNGSCVASTAFGPPLMLDVDEFELGVEICRVSATAINTGLWAVDSATHLSTSCGATVTGITSDWDDIKISVTVQDEAWVHISAAQQADGYSCYRCSQCICRPTIKPTVRVAFGNFGWTQGDACDNAVSECGGGFPGTVELSSEYDDIFPGWTNDPSNWLTAYRTRPIACRFAGVIYPWWTQPKETYTRMLLDVETGNKYYEKESHGERYMVAPYAGVVTDVPAYVPSMAVLFVTLVFATGVAETPVEFYVYVITSNAYQQYASGEFKAPYWSRECEGTPEPAPYVEMQEYLTLNGQVGWLDYDIPEPVPTGVRTLRWYYLGEEDVVKRNLGFWALWKRDAMKCEDLGEYIDLDLCESDGAPENPYSYVRTWVGGSESLPTPTQDGPCSGTFPDTIRLYF